MSAIDDLLPAISQETIAALLDRPKGERPAEDLFFEFKEQWPARGISKSVAAFANASGGFLFIGAKAAEGELTGLPGLPAGTEWPVAVANNIVGHISPLPAWEPFLVESPERREHDIVVVKVRESRRTPHILCTSGLIYQRSPGGTSDPIKDRATLDRLIERGREGDRAAFERARMLIEGTSPPIEPWRFSFVSVPLPHGSAQQAGLFTRGGYLDSPTLFVPGNLLADGHPEGMVEDGIQLRFGAAEVLLFRDGTVQLCYTLPTEFVSVPVLSQLIGEILLTQARLPSPVHEARVFVDLQTEGDVQLCERFDPPRGGRALARSRWTWDDETSTLRAGVKEFMVRFSSRLWRSVGKEVFDT